MTPILQDSIVTLIALVAIALLLGRVFGFLKRDSSSTASCSHCSSAPGRGTPCASSPTRHNGDAVPMQLIRPPNSRSTGGA